MQLLIQPGDGVRSLIKAIASAKTTIEIVIFRFDQREVERALANAVSRGVDVHALIAHTNRAGEQSLRNLEMRLLAAGVTVGRTADDLVRYHSKFMIIDRRELYVMAFNFTYLDIDQSRSFAIVTRARELVREAVRLFEADMKRITYEAGSDKFVVSPVNARRRLMQLIKGAKKELMIWDPEVSDPEIVRQLGAASKAGVRIRIIGKLKGKILGAEARNLHDLRLHTRTILRDGKLAFVGSQSLRKMELDVRREVGVIVNHAGTVGEIARIFETDWTAAGLPAPAEPIKAEDKAKSAHEKPPSARIAKKVAKAISKELAPVAPILNGMVKEIAGTAEVKDLDTAAVEQRVKDAVKSAVKQIVREAVETAEEGPDVT